MNQLALDSSVVGSCQDGNEPSAYIRVKVK
jgi:hypothetical protein